VITSCPYKNLDDGPEEEACKHDGTSKEISGGKHTYLGRKEN
jgi:hypothetical protein